MSFVRRFLVHLVRFEDAARVLVQMDYDFELCKTLWLRRLLSGATIAILASVVFAGGTCQAQSSPVGNWQSARSATYANPFLAGSELFLNIEVSADGRFRGTWAQYICFPYTGAYGVNILSCTLQPGGGTASGIIAVGGKGEIELSKLGRSTFVWTLRSPDELGIELPKKWQGGDESVLFRARLWRKGKVPESSGPPGPPAHPDAASPMSANLLYREFTKDAAGALKKYEGKTVVLEGRRGTLIELSTGGVAIHVPDGYQPRALVLMFRDARQAKGINENAKFRFKCRVESFDYAYVHLEDCTVMTD